MGLFTRCVASPYSNRVPLHNHRDNDMVEPLSNTAGYVRQGRSIQRVARGQRSQAMLILSTRHTHGRSSHAHRSGSRSNGSWGRGANMHSLGKMMGMLASCTWPMRRPIKIGSSPLISQLDIWRKENCPMPFNPRFSVTLSLFLECSCN